MDKIGRSGRFSDQPLRRNVNHENVRDEQGMTAILDIRPDNSAARSLAESFNETTLADYLGFAASGHVQDVRWYD